MSSELSKTSQILIQAMTEAVTLASAVPREVAEAALVRAAEFFGELHNVNGNLWDTRDAENNFVLGKFTFSTVAGILPGTTLEQHGVLEYHARNLLGGLDDHCVVDQLEQVQRGRPINLMGYISGGTSQQGQIGLQLDHRLLNLPQPESDRLYKAVCHAAYLLAHAGFDPRKPIVFHAELNNKYGYSRSRKATYEALKKAGMAEAELPLYRAQVYITMPHLLPCNEDLLCEELIQHDLGYWAAH